jgi:hypothetical protein
LTITAYAYSLLGFKEGLMVQLHLMIAHLEAANERVISANENSLSFLLPELLVHAIIDLINLILGKIEFALSILRMGEST